MNKTLLLIKERNMADWISLSTLFPILLSYYFILQGRPNEAIIAHSISFILDTLDGYLARKFKISTEFGKQLDSSIDILNYLIFSGLFIFNFLNYNIFITIFVLSITIGAGILRLIRFDSTGIFIAENKKYYLGLPVPFVSFSILFAFYISLYFWSGIINFIPLIMFVIAILMLTEIKIVKNYCQSIGVITSILYICLSIINLTK
ncbi:MAG: CDP-alcohol phosphatidyltransferase family protein [bacterium]|nr:CDP-alcohol phosphatidyltransferase family protein [bacterium]